MNTNSKLQHKDAKPQSDAKGAVLDIGMQCFFFKNPAKAAQAFALISEATHVRKVYRSAAGVDEYFEKEELIGGLKVSEEPLSSLRPLRLCVNPEKKGGRTSP